MLQQTIALLIIIFFIGRLFWQKRKKMISLNEFVFWLLFWLIAIFAILFIKKIDELFAALGFSSSGINLLFYLATVILFYFYLKIRLRIEKMERNLTKIVREIALTNKK